MRCQDRMHGCRHVPDEGCEGSLSASSRLYCHIFARWRSLRALTLSQANLPTSAGSATLAVAALHLPTSCQIAAVWPRGGSKHIGKRANELLSS
ncbi:hypothetical protein K402DRAFT_236973 [Aulographum hederae CBS 113979]|uniref:Uncharacterized protein n=1 Tax=Aulographum hederae CBS 113979 TaxID=1176131 RepID=A0A6G1GKW8_9PEZI|nr:hypothetical protein K402DRAFT_236973 [Aulographum hederae CBS 113979]